MGVSARRRGEASGAGCRGPGPASWGPGACLALLLAIPCEAAILSLPPDAGAPETGVAVVLLSVDSATGMLGTDITIALNPAVARVTSIERTALSAGQVLTFSLSPPGLARISLYGALPLQGGGDLLALTVESTGPAGSRTSLDLVAVDINEGSLPVTLLDGEFCVRGRPPEVSSVRLGHAPGPSGFAQLTWDVQPLAIGYNLYRGARQDLADLSCLPPRVSAPPAVDDGLVPPGGRAFFYLVTASTCGGESSLGSGSSGAERVNPSPCP